MRLLFQYGTLAFYDCAGVRLMLSTPESAVDGSSRATVYFRVPDIKFAHDTLPARGVKFAGPPHVIARMEDHDLWMVVFQDPDGNNLALMSEAPKGYQPA